MELITEELRVEPIVQHNSVDNSSQTGAPAVPTNDLQQAAGVLELLRNKLTDDVDHPEIWAAWPTFLSSFCALGPYVKQQLACTLIGHPMELPLRIAHALTLAHTGKANESISLIEAISPRYSQSSLVQGVLFFLRSLQEPENPKYQLGGKICKTPFQQMDVLDGGSHLCCASWLKTSVGNCFTQPWEQVWNSEQAQAIRASIHDGSYRYCNKMACPVIQANDLTPVEELAQQSEKWHKVVTEQQTTIEGGPQRVNLAYDRTCNLRCPSCRTQAYSADAATRARFDSVQDQNILPMLRHAKTVYVTGSGDPFASRNFRNLMTKLGSAEYPDLRFIIMTNGLLFNPKEWAKFPSLHGRVALLYISIDAAAKETHEKLRLGSRWETVVENMRFAGGLKSQGLIDQLQIAFTVQQENYREVGAACDLARSLGAQIYFGRITNWGTFSADEYARKAVTLSTHPEHDQFLQIMQDERLLDANVVLGDLTEFVRNVPPGPGTANFVLAS